MSKRGVGLNLSLCLVLVTGLVNAAAGTTEVARSVNWQHGLWELYGLALVLTVAAALLLRAYRKQLALAERLERDLAQRKRLEEEIRASELRFRLAFENANACMFLVGLDGRIVQANARASEIFGYSQPELEQMTVNDLALPEDHGISPKAMADMMQGKTDHASFEKRYRHRLGHTVHGLVSTALVRDAQRKPSYFISQVQDITQRHEVEEKLRLSEERHRLLAENANDVIWTMSMNGEITFVSPSVQKMRGFTQAETLRQRLDEVLTPDSLAKALAYFQKLQGLLKVGLPAENFRSELEYYCKDGSTFWSEAIAFPLISPSGDFVEVLGVTRDISQRKRYENELKQARDAAETANLALKMANAELHQLATTDPLTGVWNRRHFENNMAAETVRTRRYGDPLSMLLLDIDHFKSINDRHGHLAGDAVLIELTRRVSRQLRTVDGLGRWGGEEFVVMMPHCTADNAWQVAEKLRLLMAQEPFPGVGTITISCGVAQLKPHETPDNWFNRVDEALYLAKQQGRNRVVLAEPRDASPASAGLG